MIGRDPTRFDVLVEEVEIARPDLDFAEVKRRVTDAVVASGQDPEGELAYIRITDELYDCLRALKRRPRSTFPVLPASEILAAPKPAEPPGPKPGTIDRHSESDTVRVEMIRELIIHGFASSPRAAALDLVEERQVPGPGSAESKAKRLAKLYHQTYPRGR
jgi:hypothetical protein